MVSGAQIKISSNEGDLVDRVVTITGTPDSVAAAQYLISSRSACIILWDTTHCDGHCETVNYYGCLLFYGIYITQNNSCTVHMVSVCGQDKLWGVYICVCVVVSL